ncbi:MAG: hypothetical protein ACPGU1_21990 [Myxococcota bacterium]
MRIALSLMMLAVSFCASACSADAGSAVTEGADGAVSADTEESSEEGSVTGDEQGPAEDQEVADDATSDDEEGWWSTDTSETEEVPDSLQEEESGPDKGGDLTVSLAGMVNLDTDEGGVSVQVTETATEAVVCEFTQAVTAVGAPESACEDCEFAHLLSFGAASLTVGDEAQCLDASLVLTTRNMGHGAGDVLYLGDKGEAWVSYGTSTFAAPVWMFNMDYEPAGTGGKGDGDKGDTESCMEGCLEKGGDESECSAYCGSGGKDDDDGKDDDEGDEGDEGDGTVNEACFEACLDKGGNEAECAASCGAAGDGDEGDDDEGDDDAGGELEYSACADDFDASQPCVGTWQETLCTFGGELYWCEDGAWTNDK